MKHTSGIKTPRNPVFVELWGMETGEMDIPEGIFSPTFPH
jgi:hypothetical protein